MQREGREEEVWKSYLTRRHVSFVDRRTLSVNARRISAGWGIEHIESHKDFGERERMRESERAGEKETY
jgi:hypothetical protein